MVPMGQKQLAHQWTQLNDLEAQVANAFAHGGDIGKPQICIMVLVSLHE